MKKSTLIPIFIIPIASLLIGLVAMPAYTEQLESKEKFFATYAFEPKHYVIDYGTKEHYDELAIEFRWYSNGEVLEPQYWYMKCTSTDCNGNISEMMWETDYSMPIIVIPSSENFFQFMMYEHTYLKVNHTEFQLMNSNIFQVEDHRNLGIYDIIYTVNGTWIKERYHDSEGNVLPRISFYVPVDET